MPRRVNDNEFEAQFQAEDGYCGGSRPKWFFINADDIEYDMDESDLRNMFQDLMSEAFLDQVYPVSKDEDAFVEWAKKRIEEMKYGKSAED